MTPEAGKKDIDAILKPNDTGAHFTIFWFTDFLHTKNVCNGSQLTNVPRMYD